MRELQTIDMNKCDALSHKNWGECTVAFDYAASKPSANYYDPPDPGELIVYAVWRGPTSHGEELTSMISESQREMLEDYLFDLAEEGRFDPEPRLEWNDGI